MKKLPVLLCIFGLFISSCSSSSKLNNSASIPTEFNEERSNLVASKSTNPKTNVYKVEWSYCAEPGKIMSAQADGCAKNHRVHYFWLDNDIEPKAILRRSSVPIALSDSSTYSILILARGCYPRNDSPQPLDYYSSNTIITIDNDVTGTVEFIEEVDVEITPLSEKEKSLLAKYYSNAHRYPDTCKIFPKMKDKLAPYMPS